ncbi:MAG: RDD family protein [Caldimonas sp.]
MSTDRFAPPKAAVDDIAGAGSVAVAYAGFWIRVVASLIDTVMVFAISAPLLLALYGRTYFSGNSGTFFAGVPDFVISWVFPAVAVIVFWLTKQATPGKMLVSLRVVDAKTGATLSPGQAIGRYLAYYVSTIPLCLGFFWVAFDRRKQGWHDKLAGTVVIRTGRRGTTTPVTFEGP